MKVINRIKNSDDFALVIKKGRAKRNSSYTIHFMNNSLDHVRVGISVSKKIGNAVTRNRVKRQIRAMCKNLIDFNGSSLDIIIIARQDFIKTAFSENQSLLSDLLKTTGR